MNRLQLIFNSIDEMWKYHDTPKLVFYGGGLWDFDEEISIYIDSIIKGEEMSDIPPLTAGEWRLINQKISSYRKRLKC